MQIGPSDVILYSIFGLTVALAVNFYGELNIPIINKIQEVLIPGLNDDILNEDSGGSYSYSPAGSRGGCDAAKVFGDAKYQLRTHIKAAKKKGDLQQERELKERLEMVKEQELNACP